MSPCVCDVTPRVLPPSRVGRTARGLPSTLENQARASRMKKCEVRSFVQSQRPTYGTARDRRCSQDPRKRQDQGTLRSRRKSDHNLHPPPGQSCARRDCERRLATARPRRGPYPRGGRDQRDRALVQTAVPASSSSSSSSSSSLSSPRALPVTQGLVAAGGHQLDGIV